MNNWDYISWQFLTDTLDVELIPSVLMHVGYRMLPEKFVIIV